MRRISAGRSSAETAAGISNGPIGTRGSLMGVILIRILARGLSAPDKHPQQRRAEQRNDAQADPDPGDHRDKFQFDPARAGGNHNTAKTAIHLLNLRPPAVAGSMPSGIVELTQYQQGGASGLNIERLAV